MGTLKNFDDHSIMRYVLTDRKVSVLDLNHCIGLPGQSFFSVVPYSFNGMITFIEDGKKILQLCSQMIISLLKNKLEQPQRKMILIFRCYEYPAARKCHSKRIVSTLTCLASSVLSG